MRPRGGTAAAQVVSPIPKNKDEDFLGSHFSLLQALSPITLLNLTHWSEFQSLHVRKIPSALVIMTKATKWMWIFETFFLTLSRTSLLKN